jgi:pseudaminic acid cytidylyltransferase
MNNICIIIARGGSKRIPRKNIRSFNGKPIIEYSIQVALDSKLFDKVIVSTDDIEIAEVSRKAGAEVPFMRSVKNSDDFAGTSDVLVEVLEELKQIEIVSNYACCIYPTAPLISKQSLSEGLELLKVKKFNTVFPIVEFSYPILRSLNLDSSGKVAMNWPENRKERSQDLPNAYHDAGQFYWLSVNEFVNNPILFSENSGSIILNPMEVQDIDNENDWKLAEIKYKVINGIS